ncbi:MAG: Do family serine endopeptidase [Bacteroides sp.]|nr:Do family serine endopeptidase [Bacteroides sp.]
MKRTVKSIMGILAMVFLSAGVAGVTTYYLVQPQQASRTFEELFDNRPQATFASYDGVAQQPVDLTKAAESSLNAVVYIKSTQASKTQTVRSMPDIFDFFFGEGQGRERQVQTPERVGFGSGVIISTDGYIVTNNHVIEGSDEIDVKLNDNRNFKARLIGADPSTDLALLKIEATNLHALPVGDSDALKVGEWVLAVGNPFNLNSTVTAGIVSAKARTLGVYSGGVESFIQTDAAINRGNSGGALVNSRGELVGINSVLTSPTGTYAGYGFAIPTSIMTKVVADLKQYGTVQRALLGIKGGNIDDWSKENAEKFRELGVTSGVYVFEVIENGAAEAAGVKAEDVILELNGKSIRTMAELQEGLSKCRPGDKVKLKVLRNKKEVTLDVTLKNVQGTTKVVKSVDMEVLGAAFKEVSDEQKKRLNINYGLEVTGVTDGKMKDAGIRKGFIILRVNGQTMRQEGDIETAFKAALQSEEQVLFISGISSSGKRQSYAIDLSDTEE